MTMEVPKSNCPTCSKFSELQQLNSILIKSCTDFKNEIEQLKEEKEGFKTENEKLIAENVALKNMQNSRRSQNDDFTSNDLQSNDFTSNDLKPYNLPSSNNLMPNDFTSNDLQSCLLYTSPSPRD